MLIVMGQTSVVTDVLLIVFQEIGSLNLLTLLGTDELEVGELSMTNF